MSLFEPSRKKRKETFSFPFETEETSNLSNTQLQRLVMLEQLQVLRMLKEKLVCKQDASFSSATIRTITDSEGTFLHL
jgi:hypothetical protein